MIMAYLWIPLHPLREPIAWKEKAKESKSETDWYNVCIDYLFLSSRLLFSWNPSKRTYTHNDTNIQFWKLNKGLKHKNKQYY